MNILSGDFNTLDDETLSQLQVMNIKIYGSEIDKKFHPKDWQVRSFYAVKDKEIESYAGVARLTIKINGHNYNIRAFSWVGTIPDQRAKGIASKVLSEAVAWFEANEIFDAWLFTAQPGLANFYKRNVGTEIYDKILLVANQLSQEALTSSKIGANILIKPMNTKITHDLKHTVLIDLHFSDKQFI